MNSTSWLMHTALPLALALPLLTLHGIVVVAPVTVTALNINMSYGSGNGNGSWNQSRERKHFNRGVVGPNHPVNVRKRMREGLKADHQVRGEEVEQAMEEFDRQDAIESSAQGQKHYSKLDIARGKGRRQVNQQTDVTALSSPGEMEQQDIDRAAQELKNQKHYSKLNLARKLMRQNLGYDDINDGELENHDNETVEKYLRVDVEAQNMDDINTLSTTDFEQQAFEEPNRRLTKSSDFKHYVDLESQILVKAGEHLEQQDLSPNTKHEELNQQAIGAIHTQGKLE